MDPAPKASGAFLEGDPNSLWGRSLEKQSRAARRAQEMARSGARENGDIKRRTINTEQGNVRLKRSQRAAWDQANRPGVDQFSAG